MADFEQHRNNRAPQAPDDTMAALLQKWASTPPHRGNVGLIVFTVLIMVCLLGGTWDMPDRAGFLRGVALTFIGLHAVLHIVTIRALRRLLARGIAAAGQALHAYIDPRRVTHLDLAAGWIGFALLIAILNRLTAGNLPLGG
ncbi:MAG TPA: hypothetical protein VGB82_08330 [Alphaproteobacteria bacterium]